MPTPSQTWHGSFDPSDEIFTTSRPNRLLSLGVALRAIPVPHVKPFGLALLAGGVAVEVYDAIQARRN